MGANAVAEIAAATRATRAAGSARVHARVFTDPPQPPDRDVGSLCEGVTDLARWRTRVVQRNLSGFWEALEKRVVKRWPWLEDFADDEDDDDEPLTMGMVYIGTKGFFGTDKGGWRASEEGDVDAPARHRADPVWIVEVLARVDGAHARGSDEVAGAPCTRLGFGIDLRGHRERLGLTSRRAVGNALVAGDV
jgi:hypothetical protein